MSFPLINLLEEFKKSWLTVEFKDDFLGLDTTKWNTTLTDSGTAAVPAAGAADVNGFVTLTASDGTVVDNDEAYLYTREISKYLVGKPIIIGARVLCVEAATNAANWIFGIGEGFGSANTLLDNGGGPPADYDGACFFKVDGGTRWNFESSLGTTQQTTELNYVAGQATYTSLCIQLNPISSAEYEAVPFIDTAGSNAFEQAIEYTLRPRPMLTKHRFAYSSAGEMAMCFGVKNGSGTVETMAVDLAMLQQNR